MNKMKCTAILAAFAIVLACIIIANVTPCISGSVIFCSLMAVIYSFSYVFDNQ